MNTDIKEFDEEKIMQEIIALVRECGMIMKNADRSTALIDAKSGHKNFVTTYDKMIQEKLKAGLYKILPEAAFVGEEDEVHSYKGEGYAFIVDPIDGTSNFIKDYKMSCTSVGLHRDGKPYMGVIYNPYADEMFTAIKGKGAFLNGERIHVSEADISEALVVFGTAPYYEEIMEQSFEYAKKALKKCIDVRRSGSCALDMCAVAAGRADFYFEPRICPWDIAAGAIIVEEAGGAAITMEGGELCFTDKGSVTASNGIISMSDIE